jgi:hypothetical protein
VALAGNWWFWALAAALLATALALGRRYQAFIARARRLALRKGLIALPPGQVLDRPPRAPWSDPSWLAFPFALWVIASPWIWDYDGVRGAIATDVATGTAVIALALAGIVFPALWALNLLAGLWLATAPWLVGYGDAHGPVGLSDAVVGMLICAVAIGALASAQRQIRTGSGSGAVGRIRNG